MRWSLAPLHNGMLCVLVDVYIACRLGLYSNCLMHGFIGLDGDQYNAN